MGSSCLLCISLTHCVVQKEIECEGAQHHKLLSGLRTDRKDGHHHGQDAVLDCAHKMNPEEQGDSPPTMLVLNACGR